jgi:hypothetical protein
LWQRASESEDEEERSRLNASAVLHFKEALAFWRRAGDREGEAGALFSLASLYGDIGNQWKSSACFAQARAIQRDLYKPSLGRQISDFIARSARRFCAVTATTPEFALPLLLIFGGISAMAARWTRAPVVRWALRGSGLGLAVFLGCMAGMGWITGDVGYDHSLSYYLPARLLVVVFAGIVAWTAVRLMAKNVVASRETR